MPVARPRAMDDRVDSIIVRRTGAHGEEVVNSLDTRFNPTRSVDQILDSTMERRQLDLSKLDFDTPNQRKEEEYDDDDSDDDSNGPPPFVVTMTLPQAQATGSALPNEDPSETVVVQITPPPPPPRDGQRGGISQTTEHLLIAAGSIGATIILVMIILAIHTMRKRGLTLREAVTHGKNRVTRRGGPPTPPKTKMWEKQEAPYNADYGSMRNDTVTPPQRAMSIDRSGSTSSRRPLVALQRSESFNTRPTASSETEPQSFFLDSPPRRNNSHRRDNSNTPSSPVLPLQSHRRSASTRNTRSMSEGSDLQFPQPQEDRALSPLPPPPTFKQFLFNRRSVSGRPAIGGGMISRFSWTNSNAPQTPHDPSRDTNSHTIGRDSFMTQRSSVPRFRTVDSWVAQQSNRIEEQKLREQFRMTQTSTVYSGDDENFRSIPEVPEIPRDVASSSQPQQQRKLAPGGLPGKNVKHERHDTRTTVDTAPIFRQHPGTEVRFSTRSVVASEILDMGRKPNVLS